MTSEYAKPVPTAGINPEITQPFWDAAKRHELSVPYCSGCNRHFFYPREACPNCLSPDWSWSTVSGKARLYSWTTVFQPGDTRFSEETPYVYAMVQLDEGPRMIGNVIDVDANHYLSPDKVNTRLEAVFEDVTPEWTLVKWRPIEDEAKSGRDE